MNCVNGHENTDSSRFCTLCGVGLQEDSTADGANSSDSVLNRDENSTMVTDVVADDSHGIVKSKKQLFVIAASGLVLALIVVGVLAFGSGGSKKTHHNSGGQSTNSNSACYIKLANWVISTSNFDQNYPNSIPPLLTTFGSQSQIAQWVLGQTGTFLTTELQQGQSAADGALEVSAGTECGTLAASGYDIASIPPPA
jgi:hypothetical protein